MFLHIVNYFERLTPVFCQAIRGEAVVALSFVLMVALSSRIAGRGFEIVTKQPPGN